MSHKTQTAELIRTARLVARYGVKGAAAKLGITAPGTTYRVRRLENQLGFRIFAPYGYGRLTFKGREYLRMVNDG